MTSGTQGSGPTAAARDAVQRVLNFLSNAQSTGDFTAAHVGQQMGITLGPDANNGEGWAIYRSPDLGQVWIVCTL